MFCVLFKVKLTILNPLQKFEGAKSRFFCSRCIAAPEELSWRDKNSKKIFLHSQQQLQHMKDVYMIVSGVVNL